ncbi:DEAD-domain-containing protein [Coniophora puteana RWD-64-598 SS2]|uniref:ATP-dependent RNA helicase n=1 Tax=Coniophora puteana (strain RWD-64-598) TaxID=741705 RepID=A0A5M3MVX5_CONPW|nr:DEAD-domain-containing protein [Coniophora puteana RWD-64-598 SS2]EIW82865.1 DEAD-domain-containing protein [Coniophora puteana RWD-64-598 SS2]
MDDGLVLNFAEAPAGPSRRAVGNKGGRWTDRSDDLIPYRVKAKRTLKRKTRQEDRGSVHPPPAYAEDDGEDYSARPVKKPRRQEHAPQAALPDSAKTFARSAPTSTAPKLPPGQIISSLFSYNPKIEAPLSNAARSAVSKPSNAPLATGSGFADLGLHPLLTAHLTTKLNIAKPTSIQRASLPIFTRPTADHADRDVFIQSQTGSGKTLSFLLPIIQDLLPLSTHSWIDRSIGTLAIIIAPTRELAKQISDVLESVLRMKLRAEDDNDDEDNAADSDAQAPPSHYTRWLVSGLLSGGATRTHEKSRLRKGIPILVSTPGRLLDHLQNTSSFDVGKCRWLVLDEADRLMELGFEDTIRGIIQGLDGRRKLAVHAVNEGKSMDVGGWDWERRRRTILCSATIREDVQKLAGTALQRPLMIKAVENDEDASGQQQASQDAAGANATSSKFTPPSQLSQKYVVVPLKMRLVALVAILRQLLSQAQNKRGTKIIVFLSCTDSVDFHWRLLGGSFMGPGQSQASDRPKSGDGGGEEDNENSEDEEGKSDDEEEPSPGDGIAVFSPLLPDTAIYRLHGSLETPTRLASLRGFSTSASSSTSSQKSKPKAKPKLPTKEEAASSAVLLCTSVASRGLDLPLVRAVVQYDLPTEGGATEYVHRVGRTARAGRGGEAWSIIAPSEAEWVKWVEDRMRGGAVVGADAAAGGEIRLEGASVEQVLAKGFGGKGVEYEQRATEVQLSFERWVLRNKENAGLARRAFLAHMRAYATHPSDEKHMFHVRHLHIGHLAKAFALREAPTAITNGGGKKGSKGGSKSKGSTSANARAKPSLGGKLKPKAKVQSGKPGQGAERDWTERTGEAEARMEKAVREQGRLSKKAGKLVSSGTGEFQIASGYNLERLVGKS